MCLITMLVATSQFTAYTYITALVRRDARHVGAGLTAVLFAYGVAGIAGIWLTGRSTDRRPRLAAMASAGSLAVALAGLAGLGQDSALITVAAVALWGGAFTAIAVVLQAAVLRAAPRYADTASALYVVAFQIGIGGRALVGFLLVDAGRLPAIPAAAAALATAGMALVLVSRRTFPGRPGPRRRWPAVRPHPGRGPLRSAAAAPGRSARARERTMSTAVEHVTAVPGPAPTAPRRSPRRDWAARLISPPVPRFSLVAGRALADFTTNT